MFTREASLNIIIDGVNFSDSIKNFITAFQYSDTIDGESDTCELTLADPSHKLLKSFVPKKGSSAHIDIIKHRWNSKQFAGELPDLTLSLGSFELDEIDYNFPPSTYSIKFNSVPHKAQIKRVEKFRAWEYVSLSKIARDIASGANLQLFFDVANDPQIERAEQSQQSDLEFLSKLCKDYAYSIKVHDNKLIIFDEERYEQRPAVVGLKYGDPIIISGRFHSSLTNTFGDSSVNYFSNGIGEDYDWLFGLFGGLDIFQGFSGLKIDRDDPNIKQIYEKVSDPAEAERLARARLRDANKNENTATFNLTGSFSYLSGNVIGLEDFGMFHGKWIITRATHKLGEGYTTTAEIRKCLEW